MRPLLPIVLASTIVACAPSPPPSPADGTTTTSGAIADGGGRLIAREPVHSTTLRLALPAADPAVRRYAFWGDSAVRGVVVAEILPPTDGALRVAWRGPVDAPIALHVVAYDVDAASGVAVAWPGGASRSPQTLRPGDAWSITLTPTLTGALATNDAPEGDRARLAPLAMVGLANLEEPAGAP